MKLRVRGDSLRLRLARPEVERLSIGERVEETLHVAPGTPFTYAVRAADAEGLGATWEGSTLTVTVPAHWLTGWPDDERVGFEGTQDAGDGKTLVLLVEKDFACLHREAEEPDAFPNPLATDADA